MEPIDHNIARRLLVAVFCLCLAHTVQAHNGAVVIARPTQGITVEGDLGDWPEDLPRHPIAKVSFGVEPVDADDYRVWFRAGYERATNTLYLAVEVEDESIVLEPLSGRRSWNTQDGIEIYLNADHRGEKPPVQHIIR